MNRIVSKQQFSENVFKFEVEAPLIAKSRRAGHFVIIRIGEKGERIPLTIADSDVKRGTITLVVQRIGLSTNRLCKLEAGDMITDVVGPLGQATHIEKFGTVLCAGGGVGTAPMPSGDLYFTGKRTVVGIGQPPCFVQCQTSCRHRGLPQLRQ